MQQRSALCVREEPSAAPRRSAHYRSAKGRAVSASRPCLSMSRCSLCRFPYLFAFWTDLICWLPVRTPRPTYLQRRPPPSCAAADAHGAHGYHCIDEYEQHRAARIELGGEATLIEDVPRAANVGLIRPGEYGEQVGLGCGAVQGIVSTQHVQCRRERLVRQIRLPNAGPALGRIAAQLRQCAAQQKRHGFGCFAVCPRCAAVRFAMRASCRRFLMEPPRQSRQDAALSGATLGATGSSVRSDRCFADRCNLRAPFLFGVPQVIGGLHIEPRFR